METVTPSLRPQSEGGRKEDHQDHQQQSQEGVRRSQRGPDNVAPSPHTVNSKTGGKIYETRSQAKRREEADWSEKVKGESTEDRAARIAKHLQAYREAEKELIELKDQLQCTLYEAKHSTKWRPEIRRKIDRMREDISFYEKERETILRGSGPFREKLLNEDRFAKMAAGHRVNPQQAGPLKQADYSTDEEEDRAAGGGVAVVSAELQTAAVGHDTADPSTAATADPGTTGPSTTGSSKLLPEQVCLPPSSSSENWGDSGSDAGESSTDDGAGEGALVLQQIRMQESPVRMERLSFGNEVPEEEPAKRKKKRRNREKAVAEKLMYQKRSTTTVKQDSNPVNPLSAAPAVDLCQGIGENPVNPLSAAPAVDLCSGIGENPVNPLSAAPAVDLCSGTGERGVKKVQSALTIEKSSGDERVKDKITMKSEMEVGGAAASSKQPSCGTTSASGTQRGGAKVQKRPNGAGSLGSGAPRGTAGSLGGPGSQSQASNVAEVSRQNIKTNETSGSGSGPERGIHDGSVVPEMPVSGRPGVPTGEAVAVKAAASAVGVPGGVSGDASAGFKVTGASVVEQAAKRCLDEGGNVRRGTNDVDVDIRACVAASGVALTAQEGGSIQGGARAPSDVGETNEIAQGAQEMVPGLSRDSGGPDARPPATTSRRSYASVAAGGREGASSLSLGFGDGDLQQRLLAALRNGESTMIVGGREVNLDFWVQRHGLGAFREKRGGETVWSLPTAGQNSGRRNVARLKWVGDEACPPRGKVVELLLKMGFKANQIFALIHPYGSSEFDISFVTPEGLEVFWSNYELVKGEPSWRGFVVQAISRQTGVKKVTILTRNESLSPYDIMTWVGKYGDVVEMPRKNMDEYGIWSGSWTFMVRLRHSGNTVTHIPSAAFLGRDRILAFYQGQPKLCHRCGDPTHLSAACRVEKCTLCGDLGHLAATCGTVRCHLCGVLGHPFSRCPRSFANAVTAPMEESHGIASGGEGASRGEGTQGPGKIKLGAAKQKRQERRKKGGELELAHVVGGAMTVPVPNANLQAEAPKDGELDEEVRRIEREEGEATSSDDSRYASGVEEGKRWRRCKTGSGAAKKSRRGESSSSSLGQVQTEGVAISPLVVLSNGFQVLSSDPLGKEEGDEVPKEEVGATGGAESSPGEGTGTSEEGAGLNHKSKEDASEEALKDMDLSVSKKRGKGASSDHERERGGKKKAI